jgi:hypothetical protein
MQPFKQRIFHRKKTFHYLLLITFSAFPKLIFSTAASAHPLIRQPQLATTARHFDSPQSQSLAVPSLEQAE